MDIIHYLQVQSPIESVFQTISTPRGMVKWWPLQASGHSELGAILTLDFGPGYHWQAQVTQMVPPTEFELTLIKADSDWQDNTVGFQLNSMKDGTNVRFYNRGWKEANDHFCISNYCWAMYLRLMKRYVEHGEVVEYSDRLNV